MGANAGKKRVTMRHPDVKNPLECFEIQVEHHRSLGWEVVADDDPPASKGPAPKPAPKPTTETKES
ncbi:MAG: hypothetical protein AAGA99_27395 [Actinomycetota bacterium]